MFADPQSLTINTVATSFPRIQTDGNMSVYQTVDGLYKFTISHQETGGSRTRSMVRVDQKKVSTNPLTPGVNEYVNLGVYLVIDHPAYGYTATEIDYIVQALKAWLTTGNVTSMYGLQS